MCCGNRVNLTRDRQKRHQIPELYSRTKKLLAYQGDTILRDAKAPAKTGSKSLSGPKVGSPQSLQLSDHVGMESHGFGECLYT